jgi:hypothetical protein
MMLTKLFTVRRLWVKALKTKKPRGVILHLQEVLNDGVVIEKFCTDRGSEYKDKTFRAFLKKNHIIWGPKVG